MHLCQALCHYKPTLIWDASIQKTKLFKFAEMNETIQTRIDPFYPPCIMSINSIASVYCYPEYGFPVCLVLGSHFSLIPALFELLALVEDLEDADELIYKLQICEEKVEIHFDHLNNFASLILLSFLSSLPFSDIGSWSFLASNMNPETYAVMKLYGDLNRSEESESDNNDLMN